MSRAALQARAKLGALVKHHPTDAARIAAARRALTCANIHDFVIDQMLRGPTLTVADRQALASMFLDGYPP